MIVLKVLCGLALLYGLCLLISGAMVGLTNSNDSFHSVCLYALIATFVFPVLFVIAYFGITFILG